MATTPYTYTTPARVALFMEEAAFDASSTPKISTIQSWILEAEATIDRETKNSWKLSEEPLHYYDLPGVYYHNTGAPISLRKPNILALDSTAGDSLEIWDGANWVDYLATKTEGRSDDFWLNYERGVLYLRGYLLPRKDGVRIKFRYNSGARTLLNGSLAQAGTTATLDSTAGFPPQGVFRVEDEEIFYTGKTTTTLTGLQRGFNGTTDALHADNSVCLYVPEDIQEASELYVAIKRVTNEDKSIRLPETGQGYQESHGPRLNRWKTRFEEIIRLRREWQAYQ